MKYPWSKGVLKVRSLEEQVDLLHRELLQEHEGMQHHSQHFILRRLSKRWFPCFYLRRFLSLRKTMSWDRVFALSSSISTTGSYRGPSLGVACFLMAAWSLGNVVYSKTCLDREHKLWGIRTSGCCCFVFFFYFFLNTLVVREPQGISASTLEVGGGHVYLAVQIGLYADTGMHPTARE